MHVVTYVVLTIASILGPPVEVTAEPPLYEPQYVEVPVAHQEEVTDDKDVPTEAPEQKEVEVPEGTYCSCVLYLQSLGKDVRGDAYNATTTHSEPSVGDIAVMRYPGQLGHVALVTAVTADGFWVTESNYKKCQKTERFIPNDYPRLVGFRA